ncbi:MAG TPA: WD40 repeat domain-containing protein [Gemmataceae bacterium]|nr:WD40 repeat domain-containing protein [Gemmataceae bacterium]
MRTRLLSLVLLGVCGASFAAEPARDRFGDPLPEGAIARMGSMRFRDDKIIVEAVFSADGKTLATTGDGLSICFWDSATGKQVRRVPVKTPGSTGQVHFSADGKTLVRGGYDGIIRFVDVATGVEQKTLIHPQRTYVRALDLSRDGKTLVAIHQGSVIVWDVATGKQLHEIKGLQNAPLPPGGLIALTPDGKQFIMPHADGSLHLVEVASGKEVRALEMPAVRPGTPPTLRVQRLAISPDGRYVAFGGYSGPAVLCELATGKRVRELPATLNSVAGLAFTPNSRFLAVSTYQGVYVFGVLSGKKLRHFPTAFRGGTMRNTLVFSPDGRTLAALGSSYSIRLWDMASDRELHPSVGHETVVQSLVFLADGKRLASSANNGHLLVWDVATSRDIARRDVYFYPNTLSVAEDGRTLRFLTNDRSVHRWEPVSNRYEQGVAAVALPGGPQPVLSPDGRSLAASAPDRKIYLYDFGSSKGPRTLMQTQNWNAQLRFSPDSRRLLTTDSDNTLRLWDCATAKQVRELKSAGPMRGMVSHVAFFHDGRSMALFDGQLHIREIASGGERLPPQPSGALTALAVSPDGRFLAQGHYDGSISIRGTATGKDLAQLRGPQGIIHTLAFSPDSRLLASGGANGTILVWKLPDSDGLPATLKAEAAASLWQALADTDAVNANRALGGLAAAPAQAVPLIKERFRATPPRVDPKRLARLIANLDDDVFKVREKATRELAEAGSDAADALRKALANDPSVEAKGRIEGLLNRLDKGGSSEHLRHLRAIEVLERIGTPAAKDVLRELAGKPLSEELGEEIRASRRRMGERP